MVLKHRLIANFYREKADMWLFFRTFAAANGCEVSYKIELIRIKI